MSYFCAARHWSLVDIIIMHTSEHILPWHLTWHPASTNTKKLRIDSSRPTLTTTHTKQTIHHQILQFLWWKLCHRLCELNDTPREPLFETLTFKERLTTKF
jgi:hypothetical protein